MSTLRTNTLQTLDSAVTVDIEDLVVGQDLLSLDATVNSVADLRNVSKLLKNYVSTKGYYTPNDGGASSYQLDLSDVVSADNGGTVIVAADGGRWKLIYAGSVDILQFGMKRGVFDGATLTLNDGVLATARNWLDSLAIKTRLTFASGTYGYTVSPNWAIQDAIVEGVGEVHLQYHGVGNAWIVDGTGQPGGGCYNNRVYGFVVDAPTTALNAVYIVKCHHSVYKFKVRGAGATSAGIYIDGCVVSRWDDPEVSPNADGVWYTNATPRYGMVVTGGVGTQTSYCTFINPIMEGLVEPVVGTGLLLGGAFGNFFISGTCEGCTTGMATSTVAAGCVDNKMWGMDFEVNSDADIFEQGEGNEYHSCNCTTDCIIVSGSSTPQFFGGRYFNIEVASGVNNANFVGVTYNRNGIVGTGTFLIGSASTTTIACTDEKTLSRGPYNQFNVGVTTGTFIFTNDSGNNVQALLSGGTVSSVNITRGGVDSGVSTSGQYILAPKDSIKIANTVVPTLRILTL